MKLLKVAAVFSFAVSLAAFGAAMSLNEKLQTEKKERQNLEASGVQNQEKTAELEARAEQYKKEMERVTVQLKALSAQKAELAKEVEESDRVVADLRKKIREYEAQGTAAVNTATTASAPVIATTAATVQKAVTAVETVSAPAVKTPAVSAPAAAGSPKVLTVNRKFNFIVVNWGLKNQARIGDTLHVQRSGKVIADVQIEKVYDSFSAATILKESKDAPIQEGDIIQKA